MKSALHTTIEYTTEGGLAAVEALDVALRSVADDHAYVVIRRIKEKMKSDLIIQDIRLREEEIAALPPPPTIREERDV